MWLDDIRISSLSSVTLFGSGLPPLSLALEQLGPELPELFLVKHRAFVDALVEHGLIPLPVLTRRPTPLHASLKRLKLIIDRLLVVRHSRPALLQAACVSRGVGYVSRGVGRVSRGIGSVQA